MIGDIIAKNSKNIIGTGIMVILTTLCQQMLREQSNKTLSTAAQSVRQIKTEIRERRALGES